MSKIFINCTVLFCELTWLEIPPVSTRAGLAWVLITVVGYSPNFHLQIYISFNLEADVDPDADWMCLAYN